MNFNSPRFRAFMAVAIVAITSSLMFKSSGSSKLSRLVDEAYNNVTILCEKDIDSFLYDIKKDYEANHEGYEVILSNDYNTTYAMNLIMDKKSIKTNVEVMAAGTNIVKNRYVVVYNKRRRRAGKEFLEYFLSQEAQLNVNKVGFELRKANN